MDGKIKKEKTSIFINMVVSLVFGALVYYLFFPDVFFVRIMDRLVPFHLHISTGKQGLFFFSLLRFYFFDFLWAYAFAGILIIFTNSAKPSKNCILIPTIVGFILEVLQWLGLTSGTGDFFDVLVECAGAMAAALLIYKRRTFYEEK